MLVDASPHSLHIQSLRPRWSAWPIIVYSFSFEAMSGRLLDPFSVWCGRLRHDVTVDEVIFYLNANGVSGISHVKVMAKRCTYMFACMYVCVFVHICIHGRMPRRGQCMYACTHVCIGGNICPTSRCVYMHALRSSRGTKAEMRRR